MLLKNHVQTPSTSFLSEPCILPEVAPTTTLSPSGSYHNDNNSHINPFSTLLENIRNEETLLRTYLSESHEHPSNSCNDCQESSTDTFARSGISSSRGSRTAGLGGANNRRLGFSSGCRGSDSSVGCSGYRSCGSIDVAGDCD